jgi:predicted TIM-barrel fold metal-dependent hydrolase
MTAMSNRAILAVLVLVMAATAGVAQGPQGQRGQGAPGSRPGADREPEFPIPNIREYKPESTLVVPQHPVPKAKFAAIDFHGHPPQLTSPEALAAVVKAMDDLNVRRMVVNNPQLRGDDLKQWMTIADRTPYRDRFIYFTSVGFGRVVNPGFGRAAAEQLEADVKAGAKGIQEIAKGVGLSVRKADGSRLAIDDPELDPLWEAAARLNIPVFIHAADPQKFWDPIDYSNERWLELALFRDRRYQDPGFPRFDTLIDERNRLFKKHPRTTFVTAHLGWHANDLARLGRLFDEMPNVYSEIGAVLYDIGRQPRFAHDFFVKYQDRLLFGKDNYQPDEYPYYWRVLETSDEYFDYYRDYHAFWKLYGISLPDEVLKKLYFKNALKIIPGLSRAGFPQ